MKILPYNISGIPEQQKTGVSRGGSGDAFLDILEQTMTTSSKSEGGVMSLPPLQSISSIQFDQISNVNTTENIERVEGFLNLLDQYQSQLGDSSSTLKDFSPLVSTMEGEAENMMSLLESLPEGDRLKGILNSAMVTATVEAIKFNRGDYI